MINSGPYGQPRFRHVEGCTENVIELEIQYIKKAEIQFQLNVEAEVADYYRINHKTIIIAP